MNRHDRMRLRLPIDPAQSFRATIMTDVMDAVAPENPPGFVARTEAQKAAWDKGFRLERGHNGGWLQYESTTAPGTVWIARASQAGPWLPSVDHPGLIAELASAPASFGAGPGTATFAFKTLAELHAAFDRVYKSP